MTIENYIYVEMIINFTYEIIVLRLVSLNWLVRAKYFAKIAPGHHLALIQQQHRIDRMHPARSKSYLNHFALCTAEAVEQSSFPVYVRI